MDLGISGRTAIVCASSRGLGRACAEALAEAGCKVIVNGLDAERLKETAKEIADTYGAEVIPVAGDVSLAETQDAMIAAAGTVDILVNNNAGPPFSDFRDISREAMLKGCVQNMVTPIELIQKVIDGMAERGFGRIVNITSSAVKAPIDILGLSNGARSGLTGFVAGVARNPQLAARGVTLNNLLPGKFDTDRLVGTMQGAAQKTGKSLEEIRAAQQTQIPARRFGTPAEFGAICAFLCSQQAGYITGQNILPDGGAFPGTF